MMVTEEPDYESDFDNESDIADLEEEDDGDEENDIDSTNDNVSTNEQISTEEDNSINNKNATTITTANAALNKNKLMRSMKSSSAGSGDNCNNGDNKNQINIETKKQNNKNKQNLNGNTKENVEIDNDDDENSSTSTSSEIESEINDNEDISKRITTEFQGMKMKFHQDDRIHDVEMEYTMKQRISNSQKYIGSSTDTTNDENVQRTFQVEVFIENQRLDSDNTEESKQRTEQKVGNSTKEDTSADELSEDSSEEEEEEDNDNEDEENNNNNNQSENENESGEDEKEDDNEDEGEDEDESEDKNENENDTEFKVQNDNVKERNDKSDTSLDEKLDPEDLQGSENKNSDLNEINLKAIITDQSGNLIKYSSEESKETILNEKGAIRQSVDSSISIEISSRRPSSFNSDQYPLRLNCVNKRKSTPDLRKKQNQNKNLSFSNSRMRDIERSNQVLLKKILTQKSTYEVKSKQKKNVKNNTRQTSAEINRKKQQRQIDIDNQVLKRKLEAIAFRNRNR